MKQVKIRSNNSVVETSKDPFKQFDFCPTVTQPASNECRTEVEQKLDESFKRFWLLLEIHQTSVERMLGKRRTKVGWSVQTVWTFARHSFDQRRTNVGQKSNKSWMKCSNGFDTIQRFQSKGKVEWKSGKRLIQFKLDSTSIRQALLQRFWQSRRPVQTDPTFVRQICRMKSRAKVETV